MRTTIARALRHAPTLVAAAALFTGCAGEASLAPGSPPEIPPQFATTQAAAADKAIATLRRVTARYHDLNAALDDDFQFLHECENRPGEGPVGIVYVHFGRLFDGIIDPETPDALIYEPVANGRPNLVGVEFAVPNTGQAPPSFLGATFQPEDEFGVFGLHVWIWRHNPDGLFAEANPRVSCSAS
jgi:hypothetical protein